MCVWGNSSTTCREGAVLTEGTGFLPRLGRGTHSPGKGGALSLGKSIPISKGRSGSGEGE